MVFDATANLEGGTMIGALFYYFLFFSVVVAAHFVC